MTPTRTTFALRDTLLWLAGAVLTATALSGCIAADENERDPDVQENGDDDSYGNETIPDPLVFKGSAFVMNPAHFVQCVPAGVHAEYHDIGQDVDDWVFFVEPAGSFVVYWFDDDEGYIEGGEESGRVPDGAALAEVCYAEGTGPADYTLTLVHPDHPDA